ncbi:MAG: hypothetical protein WC006_05030 [Bacilli bacterium]
MKHDNTKLSNIYVSDKLYVLEKVDKENNIYYPGDEITFTIICINTSNEALDNILIRDILPTEVVPITNEYEVEVSSGEVKQIGNIIEARIKSILPKEAIKLIIKGKVI